MKVRDWECGCGHAWTAPVVPSMNTPNLSGEATQWCPRCGQRPVMGSPVRESTRSCRNCKHPVHEGQLIIYLYCPVRDERIAQTPHNPEHGRVQDERLQRIANRCSRYEADNQPTEGEATCQEQ